VVVVTEAGVRRRERCFQGGGVVAAAAIAVEHKTVAGAVSAAQQS